jgi:hypothetical protein
MILETEVLRDEVEPLRNIDNNTFRVPFPVLAGMVLPN